jgi:hypothetical protein
VLILDCFYSGTAKKVFAKGAVVDSLKLKAAGSGLAILTSLKNRDLLRSKTEVRAATFNPKPDHAVAVDFEHLEYLPFIGL